MQLGERQRNLDELTRRDRAIAAIVSDDVATNGELAADLGLRFPVLSDRDRSVIRAFGIEDAENAVAWPAIFVVDRERTIVYRWIADTYKIRIAAEELLRALE